MDAVATRVAHATEIAWPPAPAVCAEDASAAVLGWIVSPPRWIAVCYPHEDAMPGSATFVLGSPDRNLTLTHSWSPNRGIDVMVRPIVPSTMLDGAASDMWIDVERGVVHRTEALTPTRAGPQERSTIAVRTTPSGLDLIALDFETDRARFVGHYAECAEFMMLASSGHRYAVGCVQPSTTGRMPLVWAEIIDMDLGRRWHTDALPEAILDDGRVIASNRRVVVTGARPALADVFLLDLDPS